MVVHVHRPLVRYSPTGGPTLNHGSIEFWSCINNYNVESFTLFLLLPASRNCENARLKNARF